MAQFAAALPAIGADPNNAAGIASIDFAFRGPARLLKAGKDGQAQHLATGFFSFFDVLTHGASQQQAITNLPGYWVLACFMDTQDHHEHTTLGMERIIHIGSDQPLTAGDTTRPACPGGPRTAAAPRGGRDASVRDCPGPASAGAAPGLKSR